MFFLSLSFIAMTASMVAPSSMRAIGMRAADALVPVMNSVAVPLQEGVLFMRDLGGISSLRIQNATLQKENEALKEWYQKALTLQEENKSLSSLLQYVPSGIENYTGARVISDGAGSFAKTLLVAGYKVDDQGRIPGVIRPNAPVLSANGLIGRIIETGKKTSRVLLVTDVNSRVPVFIGGARVHAVMAGQNSDKPVLMHLPDGADIEEGSRVVTSGYGGVFPSGLPVGRVVMDKDNQPAVQLFTDFSRLLHVRIVDARQ